MDIINSINFSGLPQIDFIGLILKIAGITFSVFYFVYAVIIARQTKVMNATVHSHTSTLINFVALLQILVAVTLFLLAILFI